MAGWGAVSRLRRCRRVVAAVNALDGRMRGRSDAELAALTAQYRRRLADGESFDRMMPEALATAREAVRRAVGVPPYDEQVLGAAVLDLPAIAQMGGGEGKTLSCVLAAYLAALRGETVHVMTVNDHLAGRDAEWTEPIYRLLDLTVAVIHANLARAARPRAYAADVTYGHLHEFAYDFLRDIMAWSLDEVVQTGHGAAIVDGAEWSLFEDHRTPLRIVGPAETERPSQLVTTCAQIAARLAPGESGHYEIDARRRTVTLLDAGMREAENLLGIDDLNDAGNLHLLGRLDAALRVKRDRPARPGLRDRGRPPGVRRERQAPHPLRPVPAGGAGGQGGPATPASQPRARGDQRPRLPASVPYGGWAHRRRRRHGA